MPPRNTRPPARAPIRKRYDWLIDRDGAAAIEFGLLAPLLFALLFGIIQSGILFNNYVELTDAVRSGSRNLAISRSSTTPWTNATSAITTSAANLTPADITVTLTVDGVACTSDSACETALSTAQGEPASVKATYPCNLVIMGTDFAPGCTLSSQSTERVE